MKYSKCDFTSCNLLQLPDLDGMTIERSIFSQEEPDTEVFPPDVKNLTLIRCNLDNVKIPDGVILKDCSTRRFKVQNDGNYWLVDGDNIPLMPVDHVLLDKFKIPYPTIDDLPEKPVDMRIDYLDKARNVRS